MKTNESGKKQIKVGGRDSSGGIGTWNDVDDRGSVSGKWRIFLFSTESSPGVQLATYQMGTQDPSVGSKAAGPWSWPLISI
jgi:hypothetical protein